MEYEQLEAQGRLLEAWLRRYSAAEAKRESPPSWWKDHRDELHKAITEGVGHGTPAYTHFNRLLARDELHICTQKEYSAASRTAKAEYRKKWAAFGFDQIEKTATETHGWKTIDRNQGRFMTTPELLISFGGTHPQLPTFEMAMAHTTNYARSCIKMQGQWVEYDSMAKALTVFRLHREWMSDLETAWEMKNKFKQQAAEASAGLTGENTQSETGGESQPSGVQGSQNHSRPGKADAQTEPVVGKAESKASEKACHGL